MSFFVLSCFLNGLTITVLALFLLSGAPNDPRRTTYGLYGFAIALWSVGLGAAQLAETGDLALLWLRLSLAGGILVPAVHLHTALTILGRVDRHRGWLTAGYGLSALFLLSNFGPLFVADVQSQQHAFHWPKPGPAFHLFMGWLLLSILGTTALMVGAFRRARGLPRRQYLSLVISSVIGYAGGWTTIPLAYGFPVSPNGVILVSIGAAVLAHAVIRYRLLDFTAVMKEDLAVLVLTSFAALSALLILLAAQRAYFGQMNAQFSFLLLTLFALVLFIEQPLKGQVQTLITRPLFRGRHKMYAALSGFSKTVGTILDPAALSEEIARTLATVMGIRTAALFLHDKERGEYRLSAACGFPAPLPQNRRLKVGHPIPQSLLEQRRVLIADALDPAIAPQACAPEIRLTLTQVLQAWGAEVCLPFINKDRLVGFCALGSRTDDRAYSQEDLDLLTSLGQNAAVALDNALLDEELRKSHGLMQRADQLRSFQIVAGGFAHGMRDPLDSLKQFLKRAPELVAGPDFMANHAAAAADVARIERLIHDVLDYARRHSHRVTEEGVNDIVSSCVASIEGHASDHGVRIETRLAASLPSIQCTRQQIRQMLLNLLANALEAMTPNGGTLTVTTVRRNDSAGNGPVLIEVADTGCGIAPEHLGHIFNPFFTTKHAGAHTGMGLGLTIAHQLVQDHCGRIEVASSLGLGTRVTVTLPASPLPSNPLPGRRHP